MPNTASSDSKRLFQILRPTMQMLRGRRRVGYASFSPPRMGDSSSLHSSTAALRHGQVVPKVFRRSLWHFSSFLALTGAETILHIYDRYNNARPLLHPPPRPEHLRPVGEPGVGRLRPKLRCIRRAGCRGFQWGCKEACLGFHVRFYVWPYRAETSELWAATQAATHLGFPDATTPLAGAVLPSIGASISTGATNA